MTNWRKSQNNEIKSQAKENDHKISSKFPLRVELCKMHCRWTMQPVQFYFHYAFFTSIRKRCDSLSSSGTDDFFRVCYIRCFLHYSSIFVFFLSILRKCAWHKTQAKLNYALYAASTSFSRLFLYVSSEFYAK